MSTYTDTQKNKLLAFLGKKKQLLCLSSSKLYTSGKDGEWLDSDLEGLLCLIYDKYESTIPALIRWS